VIASYAHGVDYHDVMKKRLKALARDLDALLGAHEQRVYVDTAPVLEHALAEQGGLGWQGKHSLTINRDMGSWMMLGEIFTAAEIEPDVPADNHCGTCAACLDVCPTRAIVAPYVVDARLCISYLTIEFKGYIARELRPLMGNRIFGCDDCQMVCPWNRDVREKTIPPDSNPLEARGENILPELASLLQLDEPAFRIRFRKSPVKRTGRAGLLRNVCIAIGNSGDTGFVPLLIEALDDEEPLIRAHAAWALGQLSATAGKEQTIAILRQRQAMEENHQVREEIDITVREIKEKL
jgi:epoxyqueuosine reductase